MKHGGRQPSAGPGAPPAPGAIFRLCAGLAALALAAGLAQAQSMTPEMLQLDDNFDAFSVDRVGGNAYVAGEYRQEQRDLVNGQNTQTQDLRFEEGVEVDGVGSVYHPNFLQWLARGRFGLSQQTVDRDDETERSDGTVGGYWLDTYLLRAKPLSLHAFSSYDHDVTNRDFNVPLEYWNWRHGADVTHRGALYTNFLLEFTDEHEASEFRDTTETATTYRLNTRRRENDPDREWEFTAEHQDITETNAFTTGGEQDFDRDENSLDLRHLFEFGPPARPHQLSGNASYDEQNGFDDNSSLRLDEQLTLQHTPTLLSYYQGRFSEQTSVEQDDRLIEGRTGLRKSIYASLEVDGSINARDRQFNEGSEQAFGGEIVTAYRKMTPAGPYHSGLSAGRSYEQEESEGGVRRIIDEAIVLVGVNFVPLSQPNADPDSLLVTDPAQVPYIRDIHYTVRQTGAFVEIARILGAPDGIPDGAIVLVDYTAAIATDAEFTSDSLTWTNRFTLKPIPLSFYSTYHLRDETLTGGTDPGNLTDLWSLLLGTDWVSGGFTVAYEHEWLETNLGLSHVADRIRGRYTRMFGQDWRLSTGADLENLTYTDEEELTADEADYQLNYGAFAEATDRLTRDLLWRTRVDWRNIEGRQETAYTEFLTGLEWRYRRLQFGVEGKYRMFEQEQSEGDLAAVQFRLSRYF